MNSYDDGNYRGGRTNGHTILLMEANEGERTFSDYPNLADCLETIVHMYESYRETCCQRSEGDLKEFYIWIGDFFRIDLLVFNKSIARYKHTPREKLKQLFEDNPTSEEAADETPNVPSKRNHVSSRMKSGYGRGSNGSSNIDELDENIGEQINDDSEEENWDT